MQREYGETNHLTSAAQLATPKCPIEDKSGASSANVTPVKIKVEEYDSAYDYVICCESVRGADSLCCSQCSSNPFHHACVSGWNFQDTCP